MRLLFIGPQGSGKSTQAKIFADKLNIPHIQSGQLVRNEAKKHTESGQRARNLIEHGRLAPDDLVADLVRDRLRQKDAENGFVLDGYPRHRKQADIFMPQLDLVINLILPRDEAIKRLMLRNREDDTPKAIKTRLDTFESLTEPLIEQFRHEHIICDIDATPSVKSVTKAIQKALNDQN